MQRVRMFAVMFSLCVAVVLAAGFAVQAGDDKAEATPSLYDRLGGLPAISVVVSDFIDAMVPDSMLNLNPAIAEARVRVPKEYLKYHVTAMVCWAAGGPCQYQGKSMPESHAHLNITEAEWDRMVVILTDVLKKHSVPATETAELMAIVETTHDDIVASH